MKIVTDEAKKNISDSVSFYWSDEDNRKKASERAKEFVNEEWKNKVGQAVKEAYAKKDKNEKQKLIDSKKKPIKDNFGNIFNSIKEAAILLGCPASSIVRQISGKYKTAGGRSFSYIDENDNE